MSVDDPSWIANMSMQLFLSCNLSTLAQEATRPAKVNKLRTMQLEVSSQICTTICFDYTLNEVINNSKKQANASSNDCSDTALKRGDPQSHTTKHACVADN